MLRTFTLFLLIAVTFCCTVLAQKAGGQNKGGECEPDSKARIRFTLAFEHKNSLPPYSVGAYLFVRPTDYNREFMKNLVLSLNSKYCSENLVSAAIFDDKRKAKDTDIAAYSLGKLKEPAVRGFYWLDREKRTSGVKFSTERGKPVDEVIIEFALDDR